MYSQEDLIRLKKTIDYLESYKDGLVSFLMSSAYSDNNLTHAQYEAIQNEIFRVNNFCRSLRKSIEEDNHKKYVGTSWKQIIK